MPTSAAPMNSTVVNAPSGPRILRLLPAVAAGLPCSGMDSVFKGAITRPFSFPKRHLQLPRAGGYGRIQGPGENSPSGIPLYMQTVILQRKNGRGGWIADR